MFNLIRRISYGVIPRADRPWEEDPTSNAPNTKRKRRLSTSANDVVDDEDQANKKKARGESSTPSVVDAEGAALVPVPQVDTAEVKDVTRGVDHVHLDGNEEKGAPADGPAPESVPLPDETADELEDSAADAPSSPAAEAAAEDEPAADGVAEDTTTDAVDDASDVASSSADDTAPEPTQIVESQEPVSTVQSASVAHAAPDLEAQA
ncbi:hypothetical protein HYPSUDRAFT_205892 [Hypholoma sublateritium FD-334 SS-4]|uniref:Uncharacterized protein n=1 Tax=Hypholoma sublateritium (strain FD-334 SS-4) TaxID=945553 RepID=A0A0D2M3N4_HYPSF|nr:hypothetical protein HYPSUDRAFT_205892 [Hypholoma sublateritium FD-334 SS-4]